MEKAGEGRAPLVVGAVIGVMLGGVVGGGLHFTLAVSSQAKVRRGWNLVPVVVAARALRPGAEVRMEDLSQRSIPEQYVTNSIVKPDSAASAVNQRLVFPVAEGEPLRWSHFESAKEKSSLQEWLAGEVERKACADELSARGWAPKLTSSSAIRDRLRRGGTP